MNRLIQLKRFVAIIDKLQRCGYVSRDELLYTVREKCDGKELDIRTLQRDFHSIWELFGITIKYARGLGYYLADREEMSGTMTDMLSDFMILCHLGQDPDLNEVILPETRSMVFSVSIVDVMKAAKECQSVEFDYVYLREKSRRRHKVVDPYYVKNSQHRWYLVAMDHKDLKLKCFELGRIEDFKVTDSRFVKDKSIDVRALFRESFGIWNDSSTPVEIILLKFDSLDGGFIKTLPIHQSQEIVSEDENSVIISLKLRITNDFVMALLSRSRSVEVIEPLHLRQRLNDIYKDALERNSIKGN
ncbi:MAG: WYL domain-containing protein [Bacteroidales bacterium]|nr:WYL domain-containing protein [Bacteroidales bacterium]MBR6466267.1 WYL domain-containing protein [Bacteroidales bacterium]